MIAAPYEDSRAVYPDAYIAGQATALRLINSPADRERVPFALSLVEAHLARWPLTPAKNGLTESQHARSRGFRDQLRFYLSQTGKVTHVR
jgi:hypothetical protein